MNRNLLKNIIFYIFVFILLIIQSSNILSILGINPDVILITIILYTIKYGDFNGQLFGFILGILEDTFSGSLFGLNAFILVLISFFLVLYQKYIFVSDIFSILIYIILSTIVKYLFYIFFYWALGVGNILDWLILLKLSGEIVYNCFIGTILFYLLPLFYNKEEIIF